MADFGKTNGDAVFVPKKQAKEYIAYKRGDAVAENMFSPDHVAVNDAYRDNFDKIFGEKKSEDLSDKVFDGKNWVPKKKTR